MSQALQKTGNLPQALTNQSIHDRFVQVLGSEKSATVFISALLAVYNGNDRLQSCTTKSILSAAGVAATVGLPLTPNLGYAYIVPYGKDATFQIGYKGLIQLALRTGEYRKINASAVYEGEIKGFHRITGDPILGDKTSDKVVGYVAYFELSSGFNKTLYMTVEEIKTHAEKYSKTYNQPGGIWKQNFDKMAKKTVLKLLLKDYGQLTNNLSMVIESDQAVVTKNSVRYVDNDDRTVERQYTKPSDDVLPFYLTEEEELNAVEQAEKVENT